MWIKTLNQYDVDKDGYFSTFDFTGNTTSEVSFKFTTYSTPNAKFRKVRNIMDVVRSVLRILLTIANIP